MVIVVVAIAISAAVVGGVIAARGGSGSLDASQIADSSTRVGDGESLPSFSTTNAADGSAFTSADVEGPAVIQVFASWCSVCQSEAPGFAKLQDEHPDLNYYLLNVEDEESAARGFMDHFGWSTKSVLLSDPRRSAEASLGLVGQPHTIFVDADGNVARTLQGGVGSDVLLDAAQQIA